MQSGKVGSGSRQTLEMFISVDVKAEIVQLLVYLKVFIKTGGMEGFAAARILAGDSWQLVAEKERVAYPALHAPVLAPLVIPGKERQVKQVLFNIDYCGY